MRIDRDLRRGVHGGEGGSFLIVAVVFMVAALGITFAALDTARNDVRHVRDSRNRSIARHAALSGVEREVADVREARDLATIANPFNGLQALDPNPTVGPGGYTRTYSGWPLVDFGGNALAELDIFVDLESIDPETRVVHVTSLAYVPTKSAFAGGQLDAARMEAHADVTVRLEVAEVFNYSYFINHWGWFYADSLTNNGSVRANGNFGFGGYAPVVNGAPRYEGSDGHRLIGYRDDNGDGVTDGSDGGVYAGLVVTDGENVRGMGGLPENQHTMQPKVDMPNLSDLSHYEELALDRGSSISLGGTPVVDAVLGDDISEPIHLYLEGTETDPIVLDGPVVVRGSVIISGYVTGQGSIYAGGNIYVPRNLEYLDGPATAYPASNDQATVEAWREASMAKDSLGLYSGEHIVIGDYTHAWWERNVKRWINNPLNESAEAKAGVDGITGTGDPGEDDVWDVSYYTADDLARGLIPPGKSVGDVIPGSGEDIDGDGVEDKRVRMSEFDLPAALTPNNWAGNLDQSVTDYADIASVYIDRLEGAFYTNHVLAAGIAKSGWYGTIEWNGSIVSRNESIIYSSEKLLFNYDQRLAGRGGRNLGFSPPVSWEPLDVGGWRFKDDATDGILDPDSVAQYLDGDSGTLPGVAP